ncbi:uncharacterized protein LOC134667254 isoform X2 [Cydia fagiglandana]|uniref:uncharacterized protein LOC134667254 isoform X2 n=1 Tax=Cydia fagiglandana TaxID=1458189 RepID=UPI002FEE596E
MSDLREHRPLLREDISDEEVQQEFRLPRRHMGYRGKAKNTVKGAAAVIKNWPDYWSSSVTYWWIGIAPTQFEKAPSNSEDNAPRSIDVENLTIDLKGNILATKSSCHAFLGSVFSNAKHRIEEDSLKEFIITELSLFCNGLLSTCKGIDVILL